LHNAFLARLRLAFDFFFPSTTVRIRIRPITALNYLVFGRILKSTYSVQPYYLLMSLCTIHRIRRKVLVRFVV